MLPTIYDSGLSVVSCPSDEAQLVDVVIVHGLQGHPFTTWLHEATSSPHRTSGSKTTLNEKKPWWKFGARKRTKAATESQSKTDGPAEDTKNVNGEDPKGVYWPADLLPAQCPRARIMVWGYDTMVTHGFGKPASKIGIFAQGRILLYALNRERQQRKPIMFIVHSLGGIIVKELLSYADSSRERDFLDIVEDTKAVVFMGTPHRGSGTANIGETARRIVSALGLDTSPAMLDSLGLRNNDLERAQQAFARIWDERRFHVKTFQEGRGLIAVNVGRLNDLVVPVESSLLGHPAEHPETLDADHLSMCKFESRHDPNYRKFGGEIARLYQHAVQMNNDSEPQELFIARVNLGRHDTGTQSDGHAHHVTRDKALLSLSYTSMGSRERSIERPASKTCTWPLANQEYQSWLTRSAIDNHYGLIRISGHPGSGKSVLMKDLAAMCTTHTKCPKEHVATFYFDSRSPFGDQKSMKGLLKTVLHQLLPLCEKTLVHFCDVYSVKAGQLESGVSAVYWDVVELQDMLIRFCSEPKKNPIYLFIDALDECDATGDGECDGRSVALFLRRLTEIAYEHHCNLNICISSRRHPAVSIRNCAELTMDTLNHDDIQRYVDRELTQVDADPMAMAALNAELAARAGGIFLWVQLALNMITQALDAGLKPDLPSVLREIPDKLEEIYDEILKNLTTGGHKSLHLFQWVLFAQRPLSANEWYHVLALIDQPNLRSLSGWKQSQYGIENVGQLAKRVRSMTGGLLEVTSTATVEEVVSSGAVSTVESCHNTSILAAAGSMQSFDQDAPIVRFIHESARQYFLTARGLSWLGSTSLEESAAAGHLYIMSACLRYTQVEELDPMIKSRPQSLTSQTTFGSYSTHGAKRQSKAFWPFRSSKTTTRSTPEIRLITLKHTPTGYRSGRLNFGSSAATANSSGTSSMYSDREEASGADLFARKRFAAYLAKLHIPWKTMNIRSQSSPLMSRLRNWLRSSVSLDPPRPISIDDSLRSKAGHTVPFPGSDSYPYLRLYAVDMFVYHAIAAHASGADPAKLLNVIETERNADATSCCWSRWCHLNDDVWPDTTPAYFAAGFNLTSWLKWYGSQRSALVSQPGGKLRFPLLVALSQSHNEAVAYLRYNTDYLVRDSNNRTCLHYLALLGGCEDLLFGVCLELAHSDKTLLGSLKDDRNQTPIDLVYVRAVDDLVQRVRLVAPKEYGDLDNRFDRNIHKLATIVASGLHQTGNTGKTASAVARDAVSKSLSSEELDEVVHDIEMSSPSFQFLSGRDYKGNWTITGMPSSQSTLQKALVSAFRREAGHEPSAGSPI